MIPDQPQALLGILFIFGVSYALSDDRAAVRVRNALIAVAVQIVFALLVLNAPFITHVFLALGAIVDGLQTATLAGTSFTFGYLGGASLPFEAQGSTFVLAFQALPLLLVVSALTAVLTHWRVLPAIIGVLGVAFSRVLRINGALSLACAANILLGMVESPIFIRDHLKRMSRSDLFVLMSVGMATVAGTVMVIYASFLAGIIDSPAGHLILASVLSIPAAISIAQFMVPESNPVVAPDTPLEKFESEYASAMDALTIGTERGLKLCLTITAMLIVFVACVALVNQILGVLPMIGGQAISLQRILGLLFMPLAWLIGIPWPEAHIAGELLGIKTVLNEFLAIEQLSTLPPGALSKHSNLIMVYALTGFANIGSLGILLGGLSTMVPERRSEILALGGRSLIAGTLATLLTGAVIGLVA